MVARAAVQHLEMHVRARTLREALEEIGQQLRLEIADALHLQSEIDNCMRTSAQIDRGDAEGFVNRHDEIAGAIDAAARAERRRHRFAQRDPEILDRMVLIDVEIALRLDGQIESAMPGDEIEHVIEEANAGGHLIPSTAVELQPDRDVGFLRLTMDYAAPH